MRLSELERMAERHDIRIVDWEGLPVPAMVFTRSIFLRTGMPDGKRSRVLHAALQGFPLQSMQGLAEKAATDAMASLRKPLYHDGGEV